MEELNIMKMEMNLDDLFFVLTAIKSQKKDKNARFRFPMYVTAEMMNLDVEELDLSVRAHNALRRAGFLTIGQLVVRIDSSDELARIRSCGKTTVSEIMMRLLVYQYGIIKPEHREDYLKRLLELNS